MKHKHKELIKLLLENGADPNALIGSKNWKGSGTDSSAFEMALTLNDAEIFKMFLQHGADPNYPGRREAHTMRYDGHTSWTPIHESIDL